MAMIRERARHEAPSIYNNAPSDRVIRGITPTSAIILVSLSWPSLSFTDGRIIKRRSISEGPVSHKHYPVSLWSFPPRDQAPTHNSRVRSLARFLSSLPHYPIPRKNGHDRTKEHTRHPSPKRPPHNVPLFKEETRRGSTSAPRSRPQTSTAAEKESLESM